MERNKTSNLYRKCYFIFFISLVSSTIIGQVSLGTSVGPGEIETLSPYGVTNVAKTDSESFKNDILGHPFYKDFLEIGSIYLDSVLIDKYPIKYNALKDEIEAHQDSSIFYLIRNKKFKVKVANGNYYYQLKELDGQNLYFIIFNGGKYSLASRITKRIKLGQAAATNYDRSTPPKYVTYQNHYVINNETNEIQLIKLKKKYLLEILQDKKENISKYASDNRLSFKKENDVVEILKYYNKL